MFGIEPTQKRRREAVFLLALVLLYLVLWIALPKPSFWGLDNGFKFQGAKAFVATGSIHIPYAGIDFDPQGICRPIQPPFSVLHQGKQLPVFSPLFMILTGIMMKILGSIGAFILPLLGGWASLLAAWYMWIRYRGRRDGRIFLAAIGLGSPLLFYSLTLWEHSWAIALVTLSAALLGRGLKWQKETPILESLLAGLLLAVATAFRTEAFLWALILIILWKRTNRNLESFLYFLAGLGGGLTVIGLVNLAATGSLFPLHLYTNLITHQTSSIRSVFMDRAKNFFVMILEGFRSPYWSVIGLIPLTAVIFWNDWRRIKNLWIWIGMGISIAWIGYIYVAVTSLNRAVYTARSGGLLWVVPFVVLSIVYLRGERRNYWRMIWIGSYFFLLSSILLSPYTRGIHWGPRFILPVLPFLLFVAATRAQRWWQRYGFTRPIIALLLLVSTANQLYSYAILYEQKRSTCALNKWINDLGSDPVLTPVSWLSGDASNHSFSNPWFLTSNPDELQAVIAALQDKGIERINYIQDGDYVKDEDWSKRLGVELLGEDRFEGGSGHMTSIVNKRVRIIPSN